MGAHQGTLDGTTEKLFESERQVGLLQGQIHALTSEAAQLRDRVSNLEQQVADAEGKASQHQIELERGRRELEGVKAEREERLKEQADAHERTLAAAQRSPEKISEKEDTTATPKQPKCGCVMQNCEHHSSTITCQHRQARNCFQLFSTRHVPRVLASGV